MEDFKEQYRRELDNQERKSNIKTLKGFCWFLAAVALIWLLTVGDFFEVDKQLVTIAFLANIVLFIPALYIYFQIDLSRRWIKYFLLLLICVVSGVIISFLSFHAVLLYVMPLLFAIQYRRRNIIWYVYGVNTATMLVSSLISFFYGLCDLNLLLQSRHVRSWYLDIMTQGGLTLPFNEEPVFIIIVFEVLPRSIILLVFSVMMQYTVTSSSEDAQRIAQLTYLKETDTKTRLFNKNKYVEMVKEYYPQIAQVAAIFWDLNNLKEINDRYGHAQGDKVIEKLSSALYAYSSERCCVYRIGGDEFLMIIENPDPGEAETLIQAVQEKLAEDNQKSEIPFSSAVGCATGSGKDILGVVKNADDCMYKDKKQRGKNRK